MRRRHPCRPNEKSLCRILLQAGCRFRPAIDSLLQSSIRRLSCVRVDSFHLHDASRCLVPCLTSSCGVPGGTPRSWWPRMPLSALPHRICRASSRRHGRHLPGVVISCMVSASSTGAGDQLSPS
ncbi:hypothetical protein PFISCL1PPCAC_7585 [Pristionchus fissidentatus]|uniref:Uncharacterized protein n=1 Tax=Pristionchus fissidentatus TaxID=1538716 RepID=A0AAV5VDL7_9BILA|nr:hypothetical protein PFISCL1PPCAC_7585 [Pristionchus fissidentatus]